MARQTKKRRGVLLLIVLSLLVLFVLIGVTFIVAAGHFKGIADSASREHLTGMPGPKLADASLHQILRGTNNPYSSVGPHNLLEDVYGRDYFVGRATSAPIDWASGNQFQEILFSFDLDPGNPVLKRLGNVPEEELRDDYYGGCVLTCITGNAAGRSTRVVSFQRTPDDRIRFEGMLPGMRQNDLFLVNGRPFNGTGAGFSAPPFVPEAQATWRLDNAIAYKGKQFPVALLPNYSAYTPNNTAFQSAVGQTKSLAEITFGGLDESWDAVDYQNVFLAKVPPRAWANADLETDRAFIRNTGGIIPSFHRPYLLTYLTTNEAYRDADLWNDRTFRRTFLFRPDATDHPTFTGSNPNYNPFGGPWDVDNDGDGLADSIWVDFGHDPVAGPDGRLYKPLVAPLIIDLDGKLNLNAAGSFDHQGLAVDFNANQNAVGANQAISQARPGLGYGPADINLAAELLPTEYPKLLRSRYQGTGETDNNATPGVGPGIDDDGLLADQGIPGNAPLLNAYYRSDQNTLLPGEQNSLFTGFGSPPDHKSQSVPYIDPTGNMLWAGKGTGQDLFSDQLDDPYETDLLLRTPRDNLFDLTDLEALLRFDDNRTPSRLRDYNFFSFAGIKSGLRRVFTTHSYHIPTIPSLNPGRWRHGFDVTGDSKIDGEGLRRSIRDMYVGKMKRVSLAAIFKADPSAVPDPQQLENEIWNSMATVPNLRNLVPPELARGEKLDINRVLQSNLPGHTPQQYLELVRIKGDFARHLFHLLMLLTDEDFELPAADVANAIQKRELHVRRLAQWAINVVDFGDADSVMTPFEYDVNPFNTDFVNYDSPFINPTNSPDRRLIWGCEHPELLLTETLAFHDRRVKDMKGGDGLRNENGQEKDKHLDQPVPPQGSLFVELYCVRGGPPGNAAAPRTVSSRGPEDLYNTTIQANSTTYRPTLDLGRIVDGSPVWRLAIGKQQSGDPDAGDSPLILRNKTPNATSFEPSNLSLLPPAMATPNPLKLNRFVWFARRGELQNPVLPSEVTPHNSYWNQNADHAIVAPGSYVVVGPRQVTHVGLSTQHLADGTSTETGNAAEDGSTSPQKIDLRFLNPDQAAQHKNVADTPLRPTKPSRVVPIIARSESGRAGVSISEPTDGSAYYPAPDPATGRYEIPFPRPFDGRAHDPNNQLEPAREQAPLALSDTDPDIDNLALVPTGTLPDHRTIFLQRLANPGLRWNAVSNPYLTVDWTPIDLTIFNSLDEDPSGTKAPPGKPFDPQDPVADGGVLNTFASREKAGEQLNIWAGTTEPGNSTAAAATSLTKSVNVNVSHTLGWLNRAFDVFDGARDGLGHYIEPGSQPTRAYDEAPNSRDPRVTNLTFPTLVWNNRPYISEYELMLVPACSQARLTQEFTTSRDSARINSPVVGSDQQKQEIYLGAFGHLLNFFHSTQGTIAESGPGTPAAQAGNYFRLFDFVTVPSRFRGTRTWYNAAQLNPNNPFASDRNFSKFREPGRVNANTGSDTAIWGALGILDGWIEFERHMAGGLPSLNADGTPRVPTGLYPSEYPNPLRAAVGADLMPPIPGLENMLAVDATLLRSSVDIPGQPLLAKYQDPKLAGGGFGSPYQNRKNNAYFRYRDIQKIANLVTSQSNVYAVWLTIGFFEIEPNYAADDTAFARPYYVDDAHPDGYRFGIELGSDVGSVKRHRAFYIIDRSIPVAFEPGVNHNVDKAVLVRRYLE